MLDAEAVEAGARLMSVEEAEALRNSRRRSSVGVTAFFWPPPEEKRMWTRLLRRGVVDSRRFSEAQGLGDNRLRGTEYRVTEAGWKALAMFDARPDPEAGSP